MDSESLQATQVEVPQVLYCVIRVITLKKNPGNFNYTPKYVVNLIILYVILDSSVDTYNGGKNQVSSEKDKNALATLNPLASLIAPLAALVLLGAASLLSSNPVLLQLAVLNGNTGRKRRRRRK